MMPASTEREVVAALGSSTFCRLCDSSTSGTTCGGEGRGGGQRRHPSLEWAGRVERLGQAACSTPQTPDARWTEPPGAPARSMPCGCWGSDSPSWLRAPPQPSS